jgi:VWFA-related protein
MRLWMLCAVLLAVCAGGAAQQMPVADPGAAAPPGPTRLSPEPSWLGPDMNPSEGRIGIDVAVTDAQGNAATGLQQSDFKLVDEGQSMPLVSFAASTANGPASGDPPVSIILVLDEADIPAANFGEAQQTVEAFLRSNDGRLARPVTVYRVVTDRAAVDLYTAGPSWDGNALADLVARGAGMRTASDVTALGAITIEQRREPGRKLLFWIGPDGCWFCVLKSKKDIFDTITELSTRLHEARIELSIVNRWSPGINGSFVLTEEQVHRYASGVRSAQDSNDENLALQVLALRTGGETLTTYNDLIATAQPGSNDIRQLIAEHIAKASNYYRLTFDPPRTDTVDEYHRLNVELARPGLAAHTVAGYYDEPVFYDQPTRATDHVTVAQLEQRLARKQSDIELAGELADLQLTERFSTPRLDTWLKRMPGSRSRQALTAVADSSVFLPPPVDEVLSLPAPDQAAMGTMLERVADFVSRQAPRLPNFDAERTIVQFGEPMSKSGQNWKTAQPDRRLDYELTTADHVDFEDGKETTDQRKRKVKLRTQDLLTTTGTFGPILVLVLKAATSQGGVLSWSHWEKGPAGSLAVYNYVSASNMRVYGVGFCCMAIDSGMFPFSRMVPIRGELAIDPATGHILRLTLEADVEPRLPLKDSAVMVEYGPVDLGGEAYICPLRSVSMSRQRTLWKLGEWGLTFRVYGPFKTVLDDVTFSRYHLFRAQTTILPGFVPVPQ